ncbi:PepSY-associated TM helix domain-containing protein [Alteromonas gracilis]|uniref:PepSY-associated TM helix domain-containing protein n=1 Tax=Alteromonas gracilis TaxID=1479524 RepID=UPI003735E8AC
MSNDRSNQRKYRKKLYNLHAWVGFQLSVVLFVILATGTIATISNEIDWLVFKEMRTFSTGKQDVENEAVKWTNIYNAVLDYAPQAKIKSIGDMGHDNFTYRVRAGFPEGGDRFIHVDQYTYEVIGDISTLTIQRFFRDFHRYLFMPNYLGLPTVTFFAFILAISLYTGLKTTRNWKTAITRLRLKEGPRILLSDLHKVSGLWSLWFFVVIVLTSWWYLFEFGAAVAGNRFEPRAPKASVIANFDQTNPVSSTQLYRAFEQAQRAINAWQITGVQFPSSETAPIRFTGLGKNPLLRERAHKVEVDITSLDIICVQEPNTMEWTNYLNEYADPLHFGYFGGLPTKLIWFVFGIALTALSVTGVLMTWKRTKTHRLTKVQKRTLPILLLAFVFFIFWLQRYL